MPGRLYIYGTPSHQTRSCTIPHLVHVPLPATPRVTCYIQNAGKNKHAMAGAHTVRTFQLKSHILGRSNHSPWTDACAEPFPPGQNMMWPHQPCGHRQMRQRTPRTSWHFEAGPAPRNKAYLSLARSEPITYSIYTMAPSSLLCPYAWTIPTQVHAWRCIMRGAIYIGYTYDLIIY